VRIPLDYYRILGLPIQASTEQLQQAHRDRVLQLPRREYSELAIEARKQLLDEAYAILGDPAQRSAYDGSFLTKTYAPDSPQVSESPPSATPASVEYTNYLEPPSIEIQESEFVGALLILQELGEYELVLKLGRAYLGNSSTDIENGKFGEAKIARGDLALTVALACLELGREQWQQRRYEDAAETLSQGQELLLREGMFANVRGELQADIYKLRPYRILELLALPLEETGERRKGLLLLQEMLTERGGMDGTGDDQSGLNTDNFLRFIQQLRVYLTSTEQQGLFEEEARRPSAVATYLAVYAFLARGFTQRQPELIRRAGQMLGRLGKRQDVYLEQAICALLLGQTEEAAKALELSGEYEALAFIRENSQGAPDLLPGLCLYSERWLQEEVFPHFRDLVERQVSLTEYFADEQVQTALEALPPEEANEWEAIAGGRLTPSKSSQPAPLALNASSEAEAIGRLKSQMQRTQAAIASHTKGSSAEGGNLAGLAALGAGGAALGAFLGKSRPGEAQTTLQAAERIPGIPPEGMASATRTPTGAEVGTVATGTVTPAKPGSGSNMPPGVAMSDRRRGRSRKGKSSHSTGGLSSFWRDLTAPERSPAGAAKQKRLAAIAIAALLGLGFLLFLLIKGINSAQKNANVAGSNLEGIQPKIYLDQPLLDLPETATSSGAAASGPITEATAKQVIQTWLDSKSAAFGQEHTVEQLSKILVDPALSKWQTQAQQAKEKGWYRKFEHSVQADSLRIRQLDNPDRARVEARVSESAQHFQGEKLIRRESWNRPNLRMRYDLVRQNDQWQIEDMTILN
jgi:ARC6-like, IMS domain/DnaJ domain